ncbi:MAG: hypothetical protein GY847_17395 [Proteobacteria bacterium]|nr:hypothetical protein [Pseudomonadota bacterium]
MIKFGNRSLFSRFWFPFLILSCLGCEKAETVSPSEAADRDSDNDSDSDSDNDSDTDGDNNSESECPHKNLTRSCCKGNGRQVCQADLTWSDCECADDLSDEDAGVDETDSDNDVNNDIIPDGNDRIDIVFDWDETGTDDPLPGECKAGLYRGNFEGKYTRRGGQFKFGGDAGSDVSGVYPGINLRLNKTSNGEIFTISDGVFHGNASFVYTFRAEIEGQLDCPSAKLQVKIKNGSYIYPVTPIRNFFEGDMEADYDKKTHSFKNGRWRVFEPQYPTLNGGWGTWHARWTKP